MNKFSKISGVKVNEPIIVKEEVNELSLIKAGMMKLMDNLLTIQSNGSVNRNILINNVKIIGKEMLAEALIDLLSDKTLNDQIKALESLKHTNRDWQSIDNRVDNIHSEINNKLTLKENINHIKKIKSFLEMYENDDKFEYILEIHANRIKDGKEAYDRSLLSNNMANDPNYAMYSKEKLLKISDKFLEVSKKLKFNNDKN
jgi:hypothetical protein